MFTCYIFVFLVQPIDIRTHYMFLEGGGGGQIAMVLPDLVSLSVLQISYDKA
jgi:hypothetical protein